MAKKSKKDQAKKSKKDQAVTTLPPPPLSKSMQRGRADAIKAEQEFREDMEGITPVMRGKPTVSVNEIMALSISVCEKADEGFEVLYENIDILIDKYPNRQQFPLALRCKNAGDDRIGRQALRNGLVDLE